MKEKTKKELCNKFTVGSKVRHIAGGPKLTVMAIFKPSFWGYKYGLIVCGYFKKKELKIFNYLPTELTFIKKV